MCHSYIYIYIYIYIHVCIHLFPGISKTPGDSDLHRHYRNESWRALEHLYETDKVRAIGVSNFNISHLQKLIGDGINIKPMVNQVRIYIYIYIYMFVYIHIYIYIYIYIYLYISIYMYVCRFMISLNS